MPSEAANLNRKSMAMIGLRASGPASAIDLPPLLRKGIPSAALEKVAKALELSTLAVAEYLGLAKRTVARRLSAKATLTPEESERVFRAARAITEAQRVFGDRDKARRWLMAPSRALGGALPVSLLDTDVGASAVFDELGRIDFGVFA